jgi:hypothetical protein
MAGDVATKVKTGTGVEGAAYICPNGLRIAPSPPQRVDPTIINTLNDASLSGVYTNRFDNISYY